jgi:hypothetical protein
MATVELMQRMMVEISKGNSAKESGLKMTAEELKTYNTLAKEMDEIRNKGGIIDIPGEIEI